MSPLDAVALPRTSPWGGAPVRAILPVFALTIFVSAALLFALEPMFTKLALPLLGGSASVWSVAMVFFQVVMLAGYSYAHVLTRWLPIRSGALVHCGLLVVVFATLPISLHVSGPPPTDADPTWWLIGLFGRSIGLPFFALSAQGPLLQAWFARSAHPQAQDPYFLYAASNIGSFAALIAYPLAIEPLVGLSTQVSVGTLLFVTLAGLIATSAALGLGAKRPTAAVHAPAAVEAPIGAARWGGWIVRAFVPSALLVSVTAHISTDVAAAPLLWVAPLGLYLLTFVLTFRDRGAAFDARLPVALIWVATLALVMLGLPSKSFGLNLVVQLAAFLTAAMLCHRALYTSRPAANSLTAFYFAMALGSALGGLFAGLAAPLMFSSVVEYPLLLVAALAVRPGILRQLRLVTVPRASGIVAGAALVLVAAHVVYAQTLSGDLALKLGFGGLGVLGLLLWRRAEAGLVVAGAMALQLTVLPDFGGAGASYRSFFGVNRVGEAREGQFRVLVHGNVVHGAIRIRQPDGSMATGRPKPATYYLPDGPIGDVIAAARATHGTLAHTAVIGLGAGALACDMRTGEPITFYEIDPVVVRLAQDPAAFRYLSACAPQAQIVTGDARLELAAQAVKSDVIVVDAFSSDAIPVHLLTREAIALDLSKLDPHGLLVFHTSNNLMEFAGIVARTATDLGLVAYVRRDLAVAGDDPDMRSASVAIVLARQAADLGPLLARADAWRPITPDTSLRPWTDDYSTILTPIAAKWLR